MKTKAPRKTWKNRTEERLFRLETYARTTCGHRMGIPVETGVALPNGKRKVELTLKCSITGHSCTPFEIPLSCRIWGETLKALAEKGEGFTLKKAGEKTLDNELPISRAEVH